MNSRTPTLLFALLLAVLPLSAGAPVTHQARPTTPAWFVPNTTAGKKLLDHPDVTAVMIGPAGRVLFTPQGAFFRAAHAATAKNQRVVFKLGVDAATAKHAAPPQLSGPTGGVFNDLRHPNGPTGIPTYTQLTYPNLLPGMDLVWTSQSGGPALQLRLAPGTDPNTAILETGAQHMALTPAGALALTTDNTTITLRPPTAWQNHNGVRRPVSLKYRPLDHGRLAFDVDDYDPKRELTITPSLDWSGFLGGFGGAGNEWIADSIVDDAGNLYAIGHTPAGGFPTTTGAHDTVYGGGEADAFVTKLDPNGALIYATFVGGSGRDIGTALAVDATGRVHLIGYTDSTDFAPAASANLGSVPSDDLFAAVLSSDGATLEWTQRLGGSDRDWAMDIALNTSGDLIITGETESPDFPTTNPQDATLGGNDDLFLVSLKADGSGVNFATYIGGTRSENIGVLAVSPDGQITVAGHTYSDDLATTPGVYLPTSSGETSFVSRYTASGSLTWCTYFAGHYSEYIYDMTLDADNNPIMVGESRNRNFPTTPDAYEVTNSNGKGGFLSKLSSDGTTLLYSSWFTNSGTVSVNRVQLDDAGILYLAGITAFAFTATPGAYDETRNGEDDAFFAVLNPAAATNPYATFLGGAADETVTGLSLDAAGRVYLTGATWSSDFPTASPLDPTLDGAVDGYVTVFETSLLTLHYSTFLGGGGAGQASDVAVDGQGGLYVIGSEDSGMFPTSVGAYDTSPNGQTDVYLTKLNAADGSMIFSTLLGGSGDDAAHGLFVDDSGQIYLTGETQSSDFPTSANAFDTSYAGVTGFTDAFVAKISNTGDSLLYSTYLGGTHLDLGRRIHADSDGLITVVGQTRSQDFPRAGASLGSWNGGIDVFITQINPAGDSLAYSNYMGGNRTDDVTALVVDNGRIFIAGFTNSLNFPSTSGAYDESGPITDTWDDAFLMKLNEAGDGFEFATFLGAQNHDRILDMVLDSAGRPVVVGSCSSPDFPTTPGVYDPSQPFFTDAFISRFSADGSTLEFSTLLGHDHDEFATAVALDENDTIFVAGYTSSSGFPVTPDAYDTTINNVCCDDDAFIAVLSSDAVTLEYSTFLGGADNDVPTAAVLDQDGGLYVVGYTQSADFPTLGNAVDTTQNGYGGGFLTLMNFCPLASVITQDPTDVSACEGGAATFTVTVTSTDTLSYQWTKDDVNVPGATQAQLTLSAVTAQDEGVYACVVTEQCGSLTSQSAVLSLISPLQITTQPQGQTFCAGETLTLTVAAQGETGLSYQWMLNGQALPGETNATLTLTDAAGNDAGDYTCQIIGACETLTSQAATLTMIDALQITTQPQGQTYCAGETLTLTVAVQGQTGLSYQWMLNGQALPGETNATLTLTDAAGSDAGDYTCQIIGACETLTSQAATLEEITLAVTAQPQGGAYCIGDEVTLSVTATSNGAIAYQWLKDGVMLPNQTQATLLLSNLSQADAGDYHCTITGDCGAVNSATATLTPEAELQIVLDPLSQTFCPGSPLTLNVEVTGNPAVTYQWFKDGQAIAGATQAQLTLASAQIADVGDYHCEITGPCDTITSAVAALDAGFDVHASPAQQSLGLNAPVFEVMVDCGAVMDVAWTANPATPLDVDGLTVTLTGQPTGTTVLTAVVTDELGRQTTLQTTLLVADQPDYQDLNGDGCNSIHDVWSVTESWTAPVSNDPNSDGVLDIRDLIYIPVTDPITCPN